MLNLCLTKLKLTCLNPFEHKPGKPPYNKGAPTNLYCGTDSMFLVFCGLEVPEIDLVRS